MADQTFPAWFYGPDGEAQVFDSADAVPAGWADHPSKAKAPKPDADPFDHDGDGKAGGSKPGPRTRKKPAPKG